MRKSVLALLCLCFAPLALAQLDSNSITVTASRGVALPADQAVFAIFVDSPLETSLDDILVPLKGAGITAANFRSVSTLQQFQLPPGQVKPMLEWVFELDAPLSKTKDTLAMLAALQQSILQSNGALKLTFAVEGTRVSPQLQQSQTCSIPDLLADARAQAQKLADAAGLGVGNILALANFTGGAAAPGTAFVSPYFSAAFLASPSSVQPACSLTVKFALGRF